MSIRSKLVIMFLAIALIPLFLVSAITYHKYKNSLEASRFRQLQNIVSFKADIIETYFTGLKVYFERSQVAYVIKKNLPVLTKLAGHPANPQFIAAKHIIDEVYGKLPSSLGFFDIMLTNPRGKVVYSSNPEHAPKEFLNFLPDPQQKAFNEGKNKIYFSDVFLNKAHNDKPGMLITGPAFDFSGNFIGVIAAEVDMSSIYEIIQDVTGLGNTGETLVAKKIGNELLYLNPLRHDPQAALTMKIKIGDRIGWPMQQAVQGGIGSGLAIDYRGKSVVSAWRYIPSLDWGIVSKIDAQEAFAEIENLRNLVIIILGIILVLASIMAFSIAQSISGPILELSRGARVIGSGNLDYKVATDSKDEIGQLSHAFDKMTQDLKKTSASAIAELAERKKAEAELQKHREHLEELVQERTKALAENERRLNRSQEIAHLGSWELDVVNNRLFWSDEVYRIFGLKTQEFAATYDAFLGLVHPDDREKVDQAYSASLRKRQTSYEIEHRVVRKSDGEVRIVLEKCEHIRDASGKVTRSIGMVHDITEQRRSQEKIDHLASFPQRSPNPIIEINADGKIIFSNYAAVQTLQRLNAAKEITQFLPEDLAVILQSIPGGKKKELSREVRIKDTVFLEHLVVLPELKTVRIYALDITERKKAEDILKRDRVTFERLVKERTEELLSARLELERAKRLSDIGTLAATVAHELRNPLAAIGLAAANIKRKAKNPDLDRNIHNIEKKVLESDQIISNLLFYSRLKPPHYEALNILGMIDECVDDVGKLFKKDISVSEEARSLKGVSIEADPLQIREVFHNILNNACDAVPAEGGKIEVTGAVEGGSVAVRVNDNGSGIAKENLEKVFNPFFSTKAKGTGLGLSVCRQIVSFHKGSIDIKSEAGKGTTVTVRLPRENK